MKVLKKFFSFILCAILLLSSAPVLNFTLFRTDAKAATYSKQHTKEYYYAPGTQFIAYLATGGNKDADPAQSAIRNSGYTLIDKDLNSGAGGDYVYLGYRTSTNPNESIRKIRVMINKGDAETYTSPQDGFLYQIVGIYPSSLNTGDAHGIVDLNKGKSRADYLHYFATKDIRAGGPIVSITIDNSSEKSGFETVNYLNTNEFNLPADANEDVSGERIYTHVTRLPEVDTTALRAAMAEADKYIANGSLYVSVDSLTEAKAKARKITDSYDNYAAGYEAFNTEYNQAAINNAKTAIDNAISALQTKLDWASFNTVIAKANGLNKNDYIDFSAVDNALKNANLIKNSFTKQEQVDNETAKINSAINSLVKKTTTSSHIQSTARADGLFQSSVSLYINNVNIGSECNYWETDIPVEEVNSYADGNIRVYQKTAQASGNRWDASTATLYVDPDVNSDILSTGVNIQLHMPWVFSKEHKARWGVELAPYESNYNMGSLQETMRSATVTSTNGKSMTYTLCDASGNAMASAETNKDFTQDAIIMENGGAYGPYTWYIKGAVPAAGDKVTVRVLGICASWAYNDNLQMLTQFTNLTIVSVSKTALKNAIYTVIGNVNNYTTASYNNYTSALNEAKTVLNNPTAEQREVNAVTTKLNNAINALQAKLNMTKLYAARDKVNALNGSNYADFSEVASLVNMIPEMVFNSQQEVDDYADRIEYAISKLVKKPVTVSKSVSSKEQTLEANNARNTNELVANGATIVSSNFFASSNFETSVDINCPPTQITGSNSHGGLDYHKVFQKASQSDANAYYIFDKYSNNTTNLASLGDILEVHMYGDATSHEHSVLLYDGTYNEGNFPAYDIQNHTSITIMSPYKEKLYTYSLVGGGSLRNWDQIQIATSDKALSLQGSIPDVGDAVQLRVVSRNGTFWFDKTNATFCYVWVTLTFVTVDSTALRNAIELSNNVLDKSKYSESSYNAYRTALSAATNTLNSDAVPNQSDYDAKTAALINAINNLKRVQTVTLDSQSASKPGTASVVATIGNAMPSITLPTREHYTFTGYFTQPDGKGVQYYNADGSSTRDYDLESDVTLYANWSIDKFNIKFVDFDGTVLRSGDFAYGTKPVYDADDPARPTDDNYEYTFGGWSPEITEITADTTYTAQYSAIAHNYSCIKVDENYHQEVCAKCGHKKATEAHDLIYTKLSDLGYGYKCMKCGYSYTDEAKEYNISFPEGIGTLVKKEIRSELSLKYYVATIQAPMNNGDKYFVYWKDGVTGEIVSTYRTYNFFLTSDRSFIPVYVDSDNYNTERNSGVFSSTATGARFNKDGSFSLYAEHSVAKTIDGFPKFDSSNKMESIKNIVSKYGVIYTTSSAYESMSTEEMKNVLVCGSSSDGVKDKPAGLNDKTRDLTGVLEVVDTAENGNDTVWARTYVVDANGETHYGTPKQISIEEVNDYAVITSNTMSVGLTDLNVESEAPTVDSDQPSTNGLIEKLTNLFTKIIEFINRIIKFFMNSGARI